MAGSVMIPRPRSTSCRPASNCGLTRSTIGDPGWHSSASRGITSCKEMNDRSPTTRSTDHRSARRRAVPHVVTLEVGHPGVGAQSFVELAVADVECHDVSRAALEQAVGESTGRWPASSARTPVHLDAECIERMVEFLGPPSDESWWRAVDHERIACGHLTSPACRPPIRSRVHGSLRSALVLLFGSS